MSNSVGSLGSTYTLSTFETNKLFGRMLCLNKVLVKVRGKVRCKILGARERLILVNKMVYVCRVSSSLVTRQFSSGFNDRVLVIGRCFQLYVTFALHLRQTSIAGAKRSLLLILEREDEFLGGREEGGSSSFYFVAFN